MYQMLDGFQDQIEILYSKVLYMQIYNKYLK